MTRDALLAEIARSLRATHPERAEEMMREVEKHWPVEPFAQVNTAAGPVAVFPADDGLPFGEILNLGSRMRAAGMHFPSGVRMPVTHASFYGAALAGAALLARYR